MQERVYEKRINDVDELYQLQEIPVWHSRSYCLPVAAPGS